MRLAYRLLPVPLVLQTLKTGQVRCSGSTGCDQCVLADFSLPAERVIRSLSRIIQWCGKPGTIRVDNGPEYISGKLLEWADEGILAVNQLAGQGNHPKGSVPLASARTAESLCDQYLKMPKPPDDLPSNESALMQIISKSGFTTVSVMI